MWFREPGPSSMSSWPSCAKLRRRLPWSFRWFWARRASPRRLRCVPATEPSRFLDRSRALRLTRGARRGSLPAAVQAAATELVVPQALGGWALVLRYGSTIGPCHDRTAPSFDIVASIGAGVELQPTMLVILQ